MNTDYLDVNEANNDEISDINNSESSNINYNSLSSNYNQKEINNNLLNTNSFVFNNNNIENDIESEIENDLKKYAKSFRYNNKQKNSTLDKNYQKLNDLEYYINRFKNLGYPDMGKIYLSPEKVEQEKTFKFFEFILSKNQNCSPNENIEKYKKQYDKLEEQIQILKLELSNGIKSNSNMQKKLNIKINKQKEFYDNQLSLITKENSNLKNTINKLTNEKNILSSQVYNMNKTINKFESMKSTIINAFEAIDYVQSNDMSKMLSRVKGAEKLIETLKGGYNESLKEYLFEISILKNFLYDINNELCSLIENPNSINMNDYDAPFMESIDQIKEAFKNNIDKIKQKLEGKNIMDYNSQVYDNCFDSLNEFINMDKGKRNFNE